MHESGEWEIKPDDGPALQYGVWHVKDRDLVWSYRVGLRVVHDANTVLSVSKKEFKLREGDGSTTIFKRFE